MADQGWHDLYVLPVGLLQLTVVNPLVNLFEERHVILNIDTQSTAEVSRQQFDDWPDQFAGRAGFF